MSVTTGAVGGKERSGGANTLLVVLLIVAIYRGSTGFRLPDVLRRPGRQGQRAGHQDPGALAAVVEGGQRCRRRQHRCVQEPGSHAQRDRRPAQQAQERRLRPPACAATADSAVAKEIADLDKAWAPLNTNVTKILDSKEQVLNTAAGGRRLQRQDAGAQLAHGRGGEDPYREKRFGQPGDDFLARNVARRPHAASRAVDPAGWRRGPVGRRRSAARRATLRCGAGWFDHRQSGSEHPRDGQSPTPRKSSATSTSSGATWSSIRSRSCSIQRLRCRT